ncbi:MAG: ATP-binding protein [bacterium]|nr:ATP-binding protein [bacterium]
MSEPTAYKNSSEHLKEELLKLDALLYLQVLKSREIAEKKSPNLFRGLYITEQEIDKITGPPGLPGNKTAGDSITAAQQIITERKENLDLKIENSLKENIELSLFRLAALFNLDAFERDILLICLAPEMDIKYEKLYAYLQDDVTRKQPQVNLVLELLCGSEEERRRGRFYLSGQGRLFEYGLIRLNGDRQRQTQLSRDLKIDEGIVNYLLEYNVLDPRLSSFARVLNPVLDWNVVLMEEKEKRKLKELAENHFKQKESRKLIFYFHGPGESGKPAAAKAFCSCLELHLLEVDVREIVNSKMEFEKIVQILFREVLLHPAAIYLRNYDRLLTADSPENREQYRSYRKIIASAITSYSFLTFLSGETPWDPPGELKKEAYVKIEFPLPGYPLRKEMWEHYLNGDYRLSGEVGKKLLANKFKFTGGQIRDAVHTARNLALMRPGNNGEISMEDLYTSCRSQTNHKLSEMACKITPYYTWDDIVLPPEKLQQLREIHNYVKYRHIVYHDWGFDAKFSLGKGLNVLFSGASGTGKTMAAEIIANLLKLELYKIDLSSIVSKYIGETEKNLGKIFKEAETANAILFFDEADALFGKRSEVKDAHDRYANIEINYLLQKMEEHEGIVILTTNLRKNIDEAFTRRMHYSVDFPFPDQEYRLRIWQNIFPQKTPRDNDIDYPFLAKKFKISGGNIKNIALNTAFLAADDGKQIRMAHIVKAIKREYQKIGNLCVQSDFGKYYELVS